MMWPMWNGISLNLCFDIIASSKLDDWFTNANPTAD